MTKSDSPPRRFQLSLRELFALSACMVAGLTLGVSPIEPDAYMSSWEWTGILRNWHYGLLGVATVLLCAELAQDAWAISRCARSKAEMNSEMRAAFRIALLWRLGVLACLIVAMLVRLADARELFKLPTGDFFLYGELVTGFIWQFAIVIALTARSAPHRRKTARTWGNSIVTTLVVAGGVAIGLYMLFEMGAVTFLVHLACAGIDAAHINADFRYAATSPEMRDQFTYLSTVAVGALAFSGVAMTRAFPDDNRRNMSPRWLALAGVILAACAAFAYWFEYRCFPQLSPDMAESGFAAAPWQRVAGVVLALMLSCCAAMNAGCLEGSSVDFVAASVTRSAVRTSLMAMALLGAMVLEMIRLSDVIDYGWEGLAYLLATPEAYLAAAVLVLAGKSIWQAWRRRGEIAVVKIVPLHLNRFMIAWVAAVAWLSVGVFTLVAAQFLFWQGSWFEW